MKLSDIQKLFSGEMSILHFRETITEELGVFKNKLTKVGSTVFIHVTEDVHEIRVDKLTFKWLLESFIHEEMSALEISYLVDAITLSNKIIFESEALQNDVESLTDPEINGALTLSKAKELLLQL